MSPFESTSMRRRPLLIRAIGLVGVVPLAIGLSLFVGVGPASVPLQARAADIKPVENYTASERSVLALDTAMLDIYDGALAKFMKQMRDRTPIILCLFSGGGGRMILYRPGQPPLEAKPVPVIYQLSKSISHSTMATYQLVTPYLGKPDDTSWRGPMQTYRDQCRSAYEALGAIELKEADRKVLSSLLKQNIAYQDACLKSGKLSHEDLKTFAHGLKHDIPKAIQMSADAQVGHWFEVLDEWKALIGKDWDHTYAATNSIYVTRQNNILFTILAQFMGKDAIGDRLLLFETMGFTTTPDEMLNLLSRIVADRSLGRVFFKDDYLMDVELLGGGARGAIVKEATRRGMTPLMPTLAPFRSNDWPWKTDPSKGTGPSTLEEVK